MSVPSIDLGLKVKAHQERLMEIVEAYWFGASWIAIFEASLKSLWSKLPFCCLPTRRTRKLFIAVGLVILSTTLDVAAQQRGENEGWFGISFESTAENADVGALARSTEIFGAKVIFVSNNGPSADILNLDDVVIQVGKERVTDQTSLQTALRLIGPDQPVDIAVIRNEKLLWLEIVTSQPPMLVEIPTMCFPFRTGSTTAFIWPNQRSFNSFREDVERAVEALGCAPDKSVLAKIEGVFDRAKKQGLTPHELINFESDLTAALGREIDTADDWYDANGLPTTRPKGPEKLSSIRAFAGSSSIESLTINECIKTLAQISLVLDELGVEYLARIIDLKMTLMESAERENPELLNEALRIVKQHLSDIAARNHDAVESSLAPDHIYACWQLSPALNEVLSLAK